MARRHLIDETTFESVLEKLALEAPLVARIIDAYGAPPLWRREPGFSSLVYAIIEQQVSLASARAVYERLLDAVGDLTPARFLALDPATLRSVGFSRRKTDYCAGLARCIVSGRLDLDRLALADDDAVRRELTAIRGIGRWTADVYLLHSLGRPDVWPVGDLALKVAVRETLDLARRPTEEELVGIGRPFRPWRSVAARVFWHAYLSRRGVVEVT